MSNSPLPPPDDLIAQFGEPADVISVGAARAYVWNVDSTGDGLIVARTAGRDDCAAAMQVQALLHGAAIAGRTVRQVAVAKAVSGNGRFHERPDMIAVEAAVEAGWCRWVGFHGADRIGREIGAVYGCLSYLEEHDVDCLLADDSAGLMSLDDPRVEYLRCIFAASCELSTLLPELRPVPREVFARTIEALARRRRG